MRKRHCRRMPRRARLLRKHFSEFISWSQLLKKSGFPRFRRKWQVCNTIIELSAPHHEVEEGFAPTPGCPILARSVRKDGIPQLSALSAFDGLDHCLPTSVESRPNVEKHDVRMRHPAWNGSNAFKSEHSPVPRRTRLF